MHAAMNPHRFAVVMAGGAGTRFWPASRRLRPKQLLPLGPSSSEALIQSTIRRLREIVPASRILIATGAHLIDATRALLPDIPIGNFLAEPVPRNTAPCIAWATAVIARRDPDAVVGVLSADHVAQDEAAFASAIDLAMSVADSGRITTIGIHPTRAETGYGYIEVGPQLEDGSCQALRFVEKPDAATAQQMVDAKRFLWNAGFFFFRVAPMRDALAQHMPELSAGIAALDEAAARNDEAHALERLFPSFPSVSIDVGVMEKVSGLAVVPARFGWSDVGSWETAWELAAHDDNGNAAPAGTILLDAANNIVADWTQTEREGKVVALLGVQDLVVVDTDDALLVMPRHRCQDVRQVVAALSKRGHSDKL